MDNTIVWGVGILATRNNTGDTLIWNLKDCLDFENPHDKCNTVSLDP